MLFGAPLNFVLEASGWVWPGTANSSCSGALMSGVHTRSGIPGHQVCIFSVSVQTAGQFSKVAVSQFPVPPTMYESFSCPMSSSILDVFHLFFFHFGYSGSLRKGISLRFILYFPDG